MEKFSFFVLFFLKAFGGEIKIIALQAIMFG